MTEQATSSDALSPGALSDLVEFVSSLDLARPEEAAERLEERFPFQGDRVQELGVAMIHAMDSGEICDRGTDDMRFSRLFKASESGHNVSADAVWMRVAGPHHVHPQGEVDLCFVTEGAPSFDGRPAGWTVYPPGSAHRPTVSGGAMMILYLLPGGEIVFTRG